MEKRREEEKYNGSFGKSVKEFTPKHLTRRMCTSVAARIYDIPGKVAPFALRSKKDLRRIINIDPEWNTAISESLRLRCIQNFQIIHEMKDLLYVRFLKMLSGQL